MGLPAMFFVRLIWKESRFNPGAVSPKGAQGIAQFMPGTAADRGLDDPFEPKSAIVHSASLLADLKTEFGNVGLAAAAYNAGAERVRAWLDGRSSLPAETIGYVSFVTGRDAEEWKLPETELPDALKTPAEDVVESCRKLAPLVVRAVYETEPLTASGAWRPWGIQVSTSFSKARALSMFARLKARYASVLSEREPFVLPERNLSRGRRAMYMVQIGADRSRRRRQALRRAPGARRRLHRAEELRRAAPNNSRSALRDTGSVARACRAWGGDGALRRAHHHALAGHGLVRRQKLPDEPLQQQRPCGYERDNILMPAQREHASIPQFPSRLSEPKLARAFPDLDDRHERCTVSIGRATKAACQ